MPPPNSLEILLPAAVDLLFHSNETEQASLTTGLEYMEWNDGMENGMD